MDLDLVAVEDLLGRGVVRSWHRWRWICWKWRYRRGKWIWSWNKKLYELRYLYCFIKFCYLEKMLQSPDLPVVIKANIL